MLIYQPLIPVAEQPRNAQSNPADYESHGFPVFGNKRTLFL